MATPTTVALYGAGIAGAVHGAAARLAGLELTCVASRTRLRSHQRSGELRVPAMDYDDLPAGADIAVVSTPPACHADDAMRMLALGAGVVLEKPLCTTLADADALVDMVETGGGRLLYAENLAYSPAVQAFLTVTRELGSLTTLEVRCLQSQPTWGGYVTREWGGGALFDLGSHAVAVALLAAAPARLVGVSARLQGSALHPTDEHAEVALRFDTGLVAHVTSSWRFGPQPLWDLQASSATGVARLDLFPQPRLERNGDEVRFASPSPSSSSSSSSSPALAELHDLGYVAQLRAFVSDLGARREPVMGAWFGRIVLDIICAAYASAGSGGTEQSVPWNGPRDLTPIELWRSIRA